MRMCFRGWRTVDPGLPTETTENRDIVGFQFVDYVSGNLKTYTLQRKTVLTSDTRLKVVFPGVLCEATQPPTDGMLIKADGLIYLTDIIVMDSTGQNYTKGGYLGLKPVEIIETYSRYDDDNQLQVTTETHTVPMIGAIPVAYNGGIKIANLTDIFTRFNTNNYGPNLPPWPSGQYNPGGNVGTAITITSNSKLFADSKQGASWKHQIGSANGKWQDYGHDDPGGPFVQYPYGTNNDRRPDNTRFCPVTTTINYYTGILTTGAIQITQLMFGGLEP